MIVHVADASPSQVGSVVLRRISRPVTRMIEMIHTLSEFSDQSFKV
jgi:hypothetical protein